LAAFCVEATENGKANRETGRRVTMSTDFTAPVQCKAEENLYSEGDVAIAAIWLALFLLMVIGVLFENQNKPMVPLIFLAALLAGLSVLGWRRKKRAAANARNTTDRHRTFTAGSFTSSAIATWRKNLSVLHWVWQWRLAQLQGRPEDCGAKGRRGLMCLSLFSPLLPLALLDVAR
jgi:hypothetical protein